MKNLRISVGMGVSLLAAVVIIAGCKRKPQKAAQPESKKQKAEEALDPRVRARCEELAKGVSEQDLFQTVSYLSSFPSRLVGTEGERRAADFVERRFRELGLDQVERRPFKVTVPVEGGAHLRVAGGAPVKLFPLWPNLVRTNQTPPEGISGQLIYGGHSRLGEYDGKDVGGNIVLMEFETSTEWFNALLLGAKAVLFIEPESALRGEFEGKFLTTPVSLPRFWIPRAQGLALREKLTSAGSLPVNVVCRMSWETRDAANITGVIRGKDKKLAKEWIVIDSYYDSMSVVPSLAPGAEGACGLAALFEVIKALKAHPPRRSIRVLATSGHFLGLAGIREFFADLIPLDRQLKGKVQFSLPVSFRDELDKGILSQKLRQKFDDQGAPLSDHAAVATRREGRSWLITDDNPDSRQTYPVRKEKVKDEVKLDVYDRDDVKDIATYKKKREAALKALKVFISLDLSTHTDKLGLFYKGHFLDYREDLIQWKFSDIGTFCRELAKQLAPILGMTEDRFADGINPVKGKNWRTYLAGKLASDAEIATLTGRLGMTFATVDDSRPFVDTPFDTIDRVNVGNLVKQTKLMVCLLNEMANQRGDMFEREIDNTYCRVGGWCFEFVPDKSYIPDVPVKGTVAVLRTVPNSNKTLMGVRADLVDRGAPDGTFEFAGLPNVNVRWGDWRVEGFTTDEKTGEIVYAPDQGTMGEQAYPTKLQIALADKQLTVVLFKCNTTAIYDMVDQRMFTLLSEINIYDAKTDSQPFSYGFCLPVTPPLSSAYEPVALIFAPPETPMKVTMGASVFGRRFVLIKATPETPLGKGYVMAEHRSIPMTPYYVARDMWTLDEYRINILLKYGIENSRVSKLHRLARKFLREADQLLGSKRYERFFTNVRAAWSYESKAYPDAQGTADDVVKGILFYLALLLPFAYATERLFFSFPDIRKQIAGASAIFIGIFCIIGLVHPAFQLTITPLVILLAFIILALTAIVSCIIVNKFEEQMRQIKFETTGMHTADVGRISASAAAFSLGISNMRRRKARTALTCVTLILLTFTVLSFTSVVSGTKVNQVKLKYKAPYYGVMIRGRAWEPLGEPMARIMQNEYGRDFPVAPRAWYLSALVGEESFINLEAENGRVYTAKGIVGLHANEEKISNLEPSLIGRWFKPGETLACVVPSGMAKTFGITAANLGKATVTALGVPLTAVGILKDAVFKKVKDLDGEALTPVNYLMMQQRRREQQQPVTAGELEEYIHHDPDSVLIAPYSFVMLNGGDLRSLAIGMSDDVNVKKRLEGLMDRIELNIYAGRNDKEGRRKTYLCSALGVTRPEGTLGLLIPILIAALIVGNTMLGSVYERTSEIGTYGALGLAPIHIAALFLAESFVYAILGAIAGYVAGQVVAKVIVAWELLPGLNLNYSSMSAVMTTILVMLVVLGSTLYPAIQASRMAVPGVERRWKLPDPEGDVLRVRLPFTVSSSQSLGINAFLKEYFEAHADYSLGQFSTDQVAISDMPAQHGQGYFLKTTVWLAPYDLGVSEHLALETLPTEDMYVNDVYITIQRESGDEASWLRVTRNFLNIVRKQFLIWRTFKPELKQHYQEQGEAVLHEGVEAQQT